MRKGITPVIAIVLLLLITVGAVGVVWTQFQSLVGNPDEDLNKQQKLRNADFTVTSVAEDTGDNSIEITMRNNGEFWNISKHGTLKLGPDGNPPQELSALEGSDFDQDVAGSTCLDTDDVGEGDGLLEEGETYTCDTGVAWPERTEEPTEIEFMLKDQRKASYSCSVDDDSQSFC